MIEVWRWNNFSAKEVLDPLFDDCPIQYDPNLSDIENFQKLPEFGQDRLAKTLDILQAIREEVGYPLRINSSYRSSDKKGRAHREFHAIDFQPLKQDENWGFEIMNWAIKQNKFNTFRLFWEYKTGVTGWIHVDSDYSIGEGKIGRFISYPDYDGKMIYKYYDNKAPWAFLRK